MNLYTIYDKVAQVYSSPMTQRTHGQASRMLQNEVHNPQSPIAQHPGDYELWHIGTWDQETGEVQPIQKERIAIAQQFKE